MAVILACTGGSRGDPHPKAQGPGGQTVFHVHRDLLLRLRVCG
jgi:hypothetical protein